MSPSSCNLPTHSHLISSIPCPQMEYSPILHHPLDIFKGDMIVIGYFWYEILLIWNLCDVPSMGKPKPPWIVKIKLWETRSLWLKSFKSEFVRIRLPLFLFVVWCTLYVSVSFSFLLFSISRTKFLFRGEEVVIPKIFVLRKWPKYPWILKILIKLNN